MNRITERKIIIVTRKTRLEELVAKYNTTEQAKFYIEHLNADFKDYQEEDKTYKKAVSLAIGSLEKIARLQLLDRKYVPNFIFGKEDIVITIGQDGLVANTLKYLEEQVLIGVNPDPRRWDGILLPFKANDLEQIVMDVLNNKRKIQDVTMAKAELNDGQSIYGVNDLFIGQKTHVSSRYGIRIDKKYELQSSSGIIISTGLGSTGWFRSYITGARVVNNIHQDIANPKNNNLSIPWDAEFLYYLVREPFPSKVTGASLVFGKVSTNNPLQVTSNMPENGVIFSDGIESDFLEFNSGVTAVINIGENKGRLVV